MAIKKLKSIKASSIKTYDDAVRNLRYIKEEKRRADQTVYEAILTQLFQKKIRDKGECVLANIPKRWSCRGEITAGHVFSRNIKELKWDERNCYPQCKSCNYNHQYYPFIYHDWLKQKLGAEYETLRTIATFRRAFIITFDEVLALIEKYT